MVVVLPLGHRGRDRHPAPQQLRPLSCRRRRLIEGGLIALGILLALLSVVGEISRSWPAWPARRRSSCRVWCPRCCSSWSVAFLAGIAYAAVAIPAQTQLQEDLPRGRPRPRLRRPNMLVSVASFLPIIIVGPIADLLGTTVVILGVAAILAGTGVVSVVVRQLPPRTPGRSCEELRIAGPRHGPGARPSRSSSPRIHRPRGPTEPRRARRTRPVGGLGRGRPWSRGGTRRPRGLDAVDPEPRHAGPGPRPSREPGRRPVHRRDDRIRLRPGGGGNVPALDGAAILARTPGLDRVADGGRRSTSSARRPATSRSPGWSRSAGVIAERGRHPSVDGVVVVQGTDTIEETASPGTCCSTRRSRSS